ncbi:MULTISPECIES: tetratricopeptide repeat protein [Streptomyces]|uniref:tetratricopeptide repeat protein n=2 Tax=Streptomyces scabiei TaxID=1930 RepID=UPI001B30B66F|nr:MULTISPECIES: tetratricopeptide repeat protein [Streptomyces]MBP5866439.1 tetratricopeptide repeat protein [Streptomyces sp. LBUM 1485]MBP5894673.1 tetratricopeptide repeat protein [Streptomyces sp. LBUM 1481]MBP5917858.1 tetratricopeptide repeat protein [Streptomyces sp. LBUM 1486]MBP5924938.1 tetratricopeptide repeat protein [Streptomyces sp. LBUM 1483]MDX2804780.1 tetratricopeptide repeat protein [Streptomyces scabiei]
MSPRTNDSASQDGRPRPGAGAPETEAGDRAPAASAPAAGPDGSSADVSSPDLSSADVSSAGTPSAGVSPSDATGADAESDASSPDLSAAGAEPDTVPAKATAAHAEPDTASADATAADAGGRSDAPAAASAAGPGPAPVGSGRGRRPESARRRAARLTACAAALAVAFTGFAVALGAQDDDRATVAVSTSPGVSAAQLSHGDLDSGVKLLQAHLKQQPKDFGSWSTLGLAYVEQARVKGDSSRYPQAEKALRRSLKLRPDNDPALAGLAALAAARHEFGDALKYADRALKENPYSERALCSRVDALVELGRYDDALKAVKLADARRPGIPVFTRYAYVHELRGDVKTARRVLNLALDSAAGRGDIAYVATQLGQLSWRQGDYKAALAHYARALGADDTYLPALEGRARAQAASGDTAEAIRGLEQVVASYPLPGPLVVLGELYEAKGDKAKARDQYALVDAYTAIARSYGVNADLDTALAAADHGDRKAALKAAEAEWKRRETVHTADALAWALHVNGRDDEALPYARRATATGYRDATFLYHRGMVENAAGDRKKARASLKEALDLNAGFSPLGAAQARKTLKALETAK